MFEKLISLRSYLILVVILIVVGVLVQEVVISEATATDGTRSVIVELKDDPGAVYKAKAERSGGTVSSEQLQAYRNGLLAGQDQFLQALSARGVNFSVRSREIKNYDRSVAAAIASRYTLVYNGITLTVPSSAISTIASMPQVKKVHTKVVAHNSQSFNRDSKRGIASVNYPVIAGSRVELPATTLT